MIVSGNQVGSEGVNRARRGRAKALLLDRGGLIGGALRGCRPTRGRSYRDRSQRPVKYRFTPMLTAYQRKAFLMGDWLEPGQKAPAFTLTADNGRQVRLADMAGNPVVLYFYPKDDTPGCTKEACAFRDAGAELAQLGAKVLGVSPDNAASHAQFRDKYALNFPLLADPDHAVAEQYGAWREKNMYGKKSMGVQRSTYLIDAGGAVVRVWKRVQVDGHDQQVLEAVRELAAGGA
jgi:thioredoxin-dependent peroxiredoxin